VTSVQTNMRLGDADRERLDRLAEARGVTRSEVVRHLLAEADDGPLPGPPDRDELVRLLGEAARGGSVRAIEILLMRKWERGTAEPPPWATRTQIDSDPFAEVDELRRRRDEAP
jgi:predicted transcriptional regulator